MKVHKSLESGFNPEERYVIAHMMLMEVTTSFMLMSVWLSPVFSLGYVIVWMLICRGLGACIPPLYYKIYNHVTRIFMSLIIFFAQLNSRTQPGSEEDHAKYPRSAKLQICRGDCSRYAIDLSLLHVCHIHFS